MKETQEMKRIILLVIVVLLYACNGEFTGDVENTHPTQKAPASAPEIVLGRNEKNQLILNWGEQDDAQNYTVYLSTSVNFEASETIKDNLDQPPYIIEVKIPRQQLFARVKSNWSSNESPVSKPVSFTTPPLAPVNIASEIISNNIVVTWNPVDTADSYTLFRHTSNVQDKNVAIIVKRVKSPHEDNTVVANQNYYYWLVANEGEQASAFSEVSSARVVTDDIIKNKAPVITSTTYSIGEKTKTITNVEATDEDVDEILTFKIIGGEDASLFSIVSDSGELIFNNPPDYETPGDADKNNVYRVEIQVSDGEKTDKQILQITVLPSTGPKVLATYPRDNKIDVEITFKNIDITFNKTMIEKTVSRDTVRVLRQDGSAVLGTVAYDQAGKTATFSAKDNWSVNETYTIEVSTDVKDTSGESLAVMFTSKFTTELPVLTVENISVDEGYAKAELTLSLDVSSDKTVTVDYVSVEGSAAENLDYVAIAGSIEFKSGETSKKLIVDISDDKLYEIDEQFHVDFSSADNSVAFKSDRATISITNNDPLPTLSISDENVSEAIANGIVEVNLNKPSGVEVTVNYSTSDDSAIASNHYQSVSGSLVFEDGKVSKTFSVPIVDNAVVEDDRKFVVNLSAANAAKIVDGHAEVTIQNDDAPEAPVLSVQNGDTLVILTWEDVTEATAYNVYYADQSGVSSENYSLLNGVALLDQSSSLIIPELNNGTQYYFVVVALAGSQESALSNQIDVTPQKIVLKHPLLNDTGITYGGIYPSGSDGSCSGETITQQDCSSGRDVSNADDTDGDNGFSFTRLDANGDPQESDANDHYCVKDNVTGLIWEVKQGMNEVAGDQGLHDADDLFSWYDENPNTNGGAVGHVNTEGATCYGYDVNNPASFCNTKAYVERVNQAGYCGFSDWRMPTRVELLSIVSFNKLGSLIFNIQIPAIDRDFFRYTPDNPYWSSSSYASDSRHAWSISFYGGASIYSSRIGSQHVRLVRTAP